MIRFVATRTGSIISLTVHLANIEIAVNRYGVGVFAFAFPNRFQAAVVYDMKLMMPKVKPVLAFVGVASW